MQGKRRWVKPKPEETVEVQLMGSNFIEVLYAKDISKNEIGIFLEHDFKDYDIGGLIDLIITIPKKNHLK